MRILLLLIVLGIGISGCTTMPGPAADPAMRSFEKVASFEGVSKNALYIKVNEWFVKTFNSAESVIEFQDKEAGVVMGKYIYDYVESQFHHFVHQTMKVEVKEGKLKMSITDPSYTTTSAYVSGGDHTSRKPLVTQKGLVVAQHKWLELFEDLNSYINSGNSDW